MTNQCSILITCLILGFIINSGNFKQEIGCGQKTLLCSCNGPLDKKIAINIEYCLTKTNSCEPCDRITDTAKCRLYQNYCNDNLNSGFSNAPCNCLNGGTCVNDSERTCICPEMFEGALCELPRPTEAPTLASKTVFCEIPQSPNAGYIAYDSEPIIPGECIHYMCNEGYNLYGNLTQCCQDSGTFNGVAPTCEKICQIPDMNYNRLNYILNPNHQEGTELIDQFGNAMITEIQFSCQDNFRLVGPLFIHCSDGIWDHKPPSCQWFGPSCKVPVIQSQIMIQKPGFRSNSVIPEGVFTYKCKNGALMKGDNTIVCSYNGSWVPQPPSCIQVEPSAPPSNSSCPVPKNPDNGFVQLSIDLNPAVPGIKNDFTSLSVGSQVVYKCKEGFQLVTGVATRTCLPDGRWNGDDPNCISECGKPNVKIPSYILNGTTITINKWPWHVGLYEFDNNRVFCGGSVLNERWVLTAAHCVTIKPEGGYFQQLKYETYGVFFGHSTSQINDSFHEIIIKKKVLTVIHHQDYNINTVDSDIALIMLDSPVIFSNDIRPVCLPTFKSSSTDISNSVGFVAGWGETDPNVQNLSLQLRYIQVKMVSNEVCMQTNVNENGNHLPITLNMFCAKGDKTAGSACHGDSGGSLCVKTGPLDKEAFQIEGIVSFTGYKGCGVKGQYDGYTRVRNFVDWIQSYINQYPESHN